MKRVVLILTLAAALAMAAPASAAEQTLSVFTGVTDDRGDNAFTLGLDYEYHLSEHFGIGGLVDLATGDVRDFIIGVPVFAHPVGGLLVLAVPGMEHQNDGSNEFLFRLGVGWEFELSERFVLTPIVNVDFVDGEEIWVYGVALEYKLTK